MGGHVLQVRPQHCMSQLLEVMAPKAMKAMKAMKATTSITKTGLAEAVATATELKKSDCLKVFASLADIVPKELKKSGKVTLPSICMVKTRVKPATKAGEREIFGKVVMVAAKPAKTVVKAFPVSALKKSI